MVQAVSTKTTPTTTPTAAAKTPTDTTTQKKAAPKGPATPTTDTTSDAKTKTPTDKTAADARKKSSADTKASYLANKLHGTQGKKKTDPKPITKEGGRSIYPPTGKDNGKKVYLMFGFDGSKKEQGELKYKRKDYNDDIKKLQEKGYTVVVDHSTTKKELKDAFYDPKTAGFVFDSHGTPDGKIWTSDGKTTSSKELDKSKISKNLKLAIFETCDTGKDQGWKNKLGKADVHNWKRSVTFGEMRDYNTPNTWRQDVSALMKTGKVPVELDDLLRNRL